MFSSPRSGDGQLEEPRSGVPGSSRTQKIGPISKTRLIRRLGARGPFPSGYTVNWSLEYLHCIYTNLLRFLRDAPQMAQNTTIVAWVRGMTSAVSSDSRGVQFVFDALKRLCTKLILEESSDVLKYVTECTYIYIYLHTVYIKK